MIETDEMEIMITEECDFITTTDDAVVVVNEECDFMTMTDDSVMFGANDVFVFRN